jgi:hypothetical protein
MFNFEIIYRNSIPPVHTYQFINVLPCNPKDAGFSIDNERYKLDISTENVKWYAGTTKEYCVSKTINESKMFLKHMWYLYKHEGKFGRYNIEKQLFEPFEDTTAEQMVHEFYYNTMSAAGYTIM